MTAVVTAANVNDTTMFEAVLDDIAPVRTPAGRRRTRPCAVQADKGDDSHANRAYLRRRGIRPRIARRRVESSTKLGRHRWKVERALSWLSCFRLLEVRWDRDSGRWFAFMLVACAPVCFNRRSSARRSETPSQRGTQLPPAQGYRQMPTFVAALARHVEAVPPACDAARVA
jgi:hypothetical protein